MKNCIEVNCNCGELLDKRIDLTKDNNDMIFYLCNNCGAKYKFVEIDKD